MRAIVVREFGGPAGALRIVQAQIDRWRVQALALPNLTHVEGPVRPGAEARLSTGAPFAWSDDPLLLYVSSSSCKDCSNHLQELAPTLGGRRAQREELWVVRAGVSGRRAIARASCMNRVRRAGFSA